MPASTTAGKLRKVGLLGRVRGKTGAGGGVQQQEQQEEEEEQQSPLIELVFYRFNPEAMAEILVQAFLQLHQEGLVTRERVVAVL